MLCEIGKKHNDVAQNEIEECYDQICELQEEGQIFAPDTFQEKAGVLKQKTAGIVDPYAWIRVRNRIENYLNENHIADVNDIVGMVEMH